MTAAIAAAQTTLTTAIGAVSTNLSTNYYTRSQVDSGISTAVGIASTTLGGQIEDMAADIIDEAGFRVAGDSALAGRLATIEARSDPGSIVTNGSFATGSFAGWSFPGGIHANFTVVARGGTNSAQQTCPSPYMVRIAADATTARTILNETREAKQGDICSVSALYAAGGTTRDVTLRFIVRYLDVAGAMIGSPFTEVLNNSGTAWTRLQTPRHHRAGWHRLRALRAAALAGRLRRRLCDRHRGPQGRRRGGRPHLDRRGGRRQRQRRDHLALDLDQRQLRLAIRVHLGDLGRGRHARRARPRPGCSARRPALRSAPPRRSPSPPPTARRSAPSRSTTTSSTSKAGSAPATW